MDGGVLQPSTVDIVEKQVCIQVVFHLPNRQPITLCQLFFGQRLMTLMTVLQLQ